MTAERWQQLKELCDLALDREPGERSRFLAKACLDDEELRRLAESMIAPTSSGVFERSTLDRTGVEVQPGGAAACPAARLPAAIGRYRILRIIGEGGMGVVYEAEQDHPQRRVALKVIKPGLGSRQTLRRFERESQALARQHHIGIAQVYEAASADSDFGPQPYFVMEFVEGKPLREY